MNFSNQTMEQSIGESSKMFKMEITIPANFPALISYTSSKMFNLSSKLEFIFTVESSIVRIFCTNLFVDFNKYVNHREKYKPM